MIGRGEISPVGQVLKAHGIEGELSVVMDYGLDPQACRCLIMEMDGLYVPFFVDAERKRGAEGSWLVKLDGVADEKGAKAFNGKTIFVVNSDLPARDADEGEGLCAGDLIGYDALTDDGRTLGKIADIDDSTENALFIIHTPGGAELLVPIADDFITDINTEAATISFDLPDGLIDNK